MMLLRLLRHAVQQPFVTVTGLAAFVHSTWTIAYLTGGGEVPTNPLQFALWIGASMFVAGSMDIGQIVTADHIRRGRGNRAKVATFLVFAAFTYYFQLIHLAHLMPVVELGAGVSPAFRDLTNNLISCALFVYPALLPISTFLYTVSESGEHEKTKWDQPDHDLAVGGAAGVAAGRHDDDPAIGKSNLAGALPAPTPTEDTSSEDIEIIEPTADPAAVPSYRRVRTYPLHELGIPKE